MVPEEVAEARAVSLVDPRNANRQAVKDQLLAWIFCRCKTEGPLHFVRLRKELGCTRQMNSPSDDFVELGTTHAGTRAHRGSRFGRSRRRKMFSDDLFGGELLGFLEGRTRRR